MLYHEPAVRYCHYEFVEFQDLNNLIFSSFIMDYKEASMKDKPRVQNPAPMK